MAVSKNSPHQRAGKQPEDTGAEDPAHLHIVEREGVSHPGGGDPGRLKIQPFHQGHHKTEPDG